VQGARKFYSSNNYAQNILLKAMSQGVTDVNELRKMAGLKTAAEVFRTLDKMAIRKEYHDALARNGISLDYIVEGLKGMFEDSSSEQVRLTSLQTLLKSLGLDKYEKAEDSGKSWEEAILAAVAKEDGESKLIESPDVIDGKTVEDTYEVIVPTMPENEKKKREEEAELAKMLYDGTK